MQSPVVIGCLKAVFMDESTDLAFVFEQKLFGQVSAPLRCFISKMRMGAEEMAIREAEADMNILSKRNRPFRHDLDIFFLFLTLGKLKLEVDS